MKINPWPLSPLLPLPAERPKGCEIKELSGSMRELKSQKEEQKNVKRSESEGREKETGKPNDMTGI